MPSLKISTRPRNNKGHQAGLGIEGRTGLCYKQRDFLNSEGTEHSMAENQNGGAPQQPVMPQMKILGQFIRDMSFENILSRKPVEGEVQPDIQVQVALDQVGNIKALNSELTDENKLLITQRNLMLTLSHMEEAVKKLGLSSPGSNQLRYP